MKKLLYTFLAVSIIFAACKKEEENNNPPTSPASIIGSWTINTINLESDTSSYTLSPADGEFLSGIEFTTGGVLYEEYTNGTLDTNEWFIIADSLYIGEDGEDFVAKHQVTNTNLTLIGPIEQSPPFAPFANTMRINATRY